MRLSDVMSHAGLSGFAVIAMILFLAAFLAIVVRTLRPAHPEEMEAMGRLPLEDDAPVDGDATSDAPLAPARGGTRR